jgi:KipI family sensor histidine kinase inhibitor
MNTPTIKPFGERGFIAQLGGFSSDVDSGLFANAVAHAMRDKNGVDDAVAGIDTIAMRFDPAQLDAEQAHAMLLDAASNTPRNVSSAGAKVIDIPVCYGGEYGPDFDALCTQLNLTPEALVKLHSGAPYRVITIGFAPGFAYLGELPEGLSAPRLETPRLRVEAGSVGVAGRYSGVYSLPSPGGWRIIGRTPLTLFDEREHQPFIFEPGDEVRFRAVTPDAFDAIARVQK